MVSACPVVWLVAKEDGRERAVDCGRIVADGRCTADDRSGVVCWPTDAECALGGDTCEGDSLRTCANGRVVTISCPSLGLARCSDAGGTAVCVSDARPG